MTDARLLARALTVPGEAAGWSVAAWTTLIAIARAEQLLGTLAHRVAGLDLPPGVAAILADARGQAAEARRAALWEAEMVRRALTPLGCPVVLLKGTAFAAAGLSAAVGRSIGDCDILVPRDALHQVEAALLAAGWEWAKPDAYDDAYYRRWMHELPPLIHGGRDRMVDVHHTILPPTARITPDADALIAGAVALGNGLSVLSPAAMVVHAAAHLLADGDLSGGLRNLWDIDRLIRDGMADDADFCLDVVEEAARHGLVSETIRALRLAGQVFDTPLRGYAAPVGVRFDPVPSDALFRRRLLARDGWGRGTRVVTRGAFYIRSHWLRMPPVLLARHLWVKWRRS